MNSAHQELLEGMIDKMLETTEQASQAIDEAIAFVEESDQRIAAMEAEAKSIRSTDLDFSHPGSTKA